MTPRRLALSGLGLGFLLVVGGVAAFSIPVAMIVAGLGLGALSLDELRTR